MHIHATGNNLIQLRDLMILGYQIYRREIWFSYDGAKDILEGNKNLINVG